MADEFVQRFRDGERPSLSEYTSQHPELAEQIREVFPLLVMMEKAGSAIDASPSAGTNAEADLAASTPMPVVIGGFHIRREIGRGGMGVVYEAEQQNLGRHVALKVLPTPTVQNKVGMERFRQEARVAARLHHTNIVPVYEVGEDQGICYYAMQYIHGQSLEQVLAEIRRLRDQAQQTTQKHQHATAAKTPATPSVSKVAQSLLDGFTPSRIDPLMPEEHSRDLPDSPTHVISEMEVYPVLPGRPDQFRGTSNCVHYYRSIARVGIQVAEALQFAHENGVIHRDIKPGNLLLDTYSRVWITDFGLAKSAEASLTKQGDVVGTLRYMAPERYRGQADARSDIFSLGLTLYEMVALRPAFDSPDRMALIHRMTREQATPIRHFDLQIPRDLETIIHKTIDSEPSRRYQTAGELATDLQRFLDHQPIQARRITPLEHVWRWCRRNPVVASLSLCLFLVVAAAFVAVLSQWQIAAANADQARTSAVEATQHRDKANTANAKLRLVVDKLRRVTYNAHMSLAHHAWQTGSIWRVRELLEQHRPRRGAPDPRQFEWYYLNRLCQANAATLRDFDQEIHAAVWHPKGRRIATVDRGRCIQFWDTQSGQCMAAIEPGKTSHYILKYSPDGKWLATANGDKAITVWDTKTNKTIRTFTGLKEGALGIHFTFNGKLVASISGYLFRPLECNIWDIKTGKTVSTWEKQTLGIRYVAFSHDGKYIIAIDRNYKVRILDARTGQDVRTFPVDEQIFRCAALSPNGKYLAIGYEKGATMVWDLASGKRVHHLFGHQAAVRTMAFSEDSTRLAVGSTKARVWDMKTGHLRQSYDNYQKPVHVLAFSPNGKQLLINGPAERTLCIWNTEYGTESFTFSAKALRYTSMDLSTNGKLVAVTNRGMTISLFDAKTGELANEVKRFGRKATCAVFSPDDQLLASGWLDGQVQLWNVQQKKRITTLLHPHGVTNIAYHPDGSRLAAVTQGDKIHIWSLQAGNIHKIHILSSPGQVFR